MENKQKRAYKLDSVLDFLGDIRPVLLRHFSNVVSWFWGGSRS